jgi:hypothetical protein
MPLRVRVIILTSVAVSVYAQQTTYLYSGQNFTSQVGTSVGGVHCLTNLQLTPRA